MTISLSINAGDAAEAYALIGRARGVVPAGGWIHIDIGDGAYTPRASWGDPAGLPDMRGFALEVHLMALDWEARVIPWLEAGAKRIIVPADLVQGGAHLREAVARYGATAMISIPCGAAAKEIAARFPGFREFQILAVSPGESGQKFDERAIGALSAMRAAFPDAILEVDGGMTPDVVRRAKAAGANIAISSSYVWGSGDPRQAYGMLAAI